MIRFILFLNSKTHMNTIRADNQRRMQPNQWKKDNGKYLRRIAIKRIKCSFKNSITEHCQYHAQRTSIKLAVLK